MASAGSSKQKSESMSSSESQAQSTNQDFGSDVWGGQSPFLTQGYQAASDVYNQTQGSGPNAMETLGQGLMTQGGATLNQLQGQPGINPAFDAYQQRMKQGFAEDFLPQLKGGAIQAGGLGGSRQQIGSALGADRAMQAISDFGANTYSGDQDRRLAAAQSAMTSGLTTADFGRSMPWYNVSQYSGLLGAPTVLNKGGYAQSTATSKSSSSSKGKSKGWNAGVLGQSSGGAED
jgi:hypothetical protein